MQFPHVHRRIVQMKTLTQTAMDSRKQNVVEIHICMTFSSLHKMIHCVTIRIAIRGNATCHYEIIKGKAF